MMPLQSGVSVFTIPLHDGMKLASSGSICADAFFPVSVVADGPLLCLLLPFLRAF